jgi:putative pyruvate formate lyase activating enzyme
MLRLQDAGVHNINLVTPSHYTLQLARLLERARPLLHIPVVWNSSAYESVDSLRALDGLVDVYLPDIKYFSPAVSAAYSSAPDYYAVAVRALEEMLRQVGDARLYSDEVILLRGVIVRHLILPGCRSDSFDLLNALAKKFGTDAFLLSLMGQYTPEFAEEMSRWVREEGGAPTLAGFRELDDQMKEGVLDFLAEMTDYEEVTVNDETFLMIHAGLANFSPDREIDDYEIDELVSEPLDVDAEYYEDKTLVVGHVPTCDLPEGEEGRIYYGNGSISLDCGVEKGHSIGCLCLETLKEFYSDAEK